MSADFAEHAYILLRRVQELEKEKTHKETIMTTKMKAVLTLLEQHKIYPVLHIHLPNKPLPAPHVTAERMEKATPEELQTVLGKLTAGRTRYYYDTDLYFLNPLDDEHSGTELDFYEDAGGGIFTPPGPITPVPVES